MADSLRLQDVWRQFTALPPARRAVLVATAAGSLGFFLWIALGQASPRFALLYSGLPEDQVAKVVDALAAERIDYRLEDGGTSVLVPASEVHEARIRVAGRGLPAGGGVGFEIFDKSGFGVTSFVQRVNFQRALQGELARSIEQLSPVERARVTLAIPDPSPFLGRNRQARASVVVQVATGHDLDPEQVRGIVHLVASSVESLAPDKVSVVDSRGRLLASETDGPVARATPSGVQGHRVKLEREFAQRIESILARTVGPGRVAAQVSADLDWTQTETTEEVYDPDSQIERSEQRESETSQEGGALAEGGVPGARSNLPGEEEGGASGPTATTERTAQTINYELSKRVSHSVTGGGKLQRLTVAVLIDGKPGDQAGEFVPWSDEEIAQFEKLTRQAIGFSEERGDEIVVVNAPFHSFELGDDGGDVNPDLILLVTEGVRWIALLGALVVFGLFVVRPLARSVTAEGGVAATLPARLEDLESRLAVVGAEAASLQNRPSPGEISQVAQNPSDETLRTLREWLSHE
ncbi:MAG: flagellar basal-body MS-ring/collar protein FliF [Myxococcota bacterium]